ncbi:NRDE family protein [Natronococcus occultus]|uniref:NRDE family protein n=1 Tax=Natronococcus occultus SP4 TaxID=694430 RepID=L0JZW4_9EURY|nr:NRDE family protein [Natronococcus occultus]AGB37408.1 hypothetical protein Natoc_1603 [Natronococcus occultus SP4]
MCTLTLAWQVFEDAPVAVAANRDESLERESVPPGVYREEPRIVAPRDAEAGGTWIGYNEHGVFAGVTNRWGTPELAGDRSRGLLVADVLEARSAREAAEIVAEETAAREYDGFYLVIADERDAVCLQWNGALERTTPEPGVHVVVNVPVDDADRLPPGRIDAAREQAANARRVRAELAPDCDEDVDGWLERAGDVLGTHEYGVCVHGDGYGTKSSSLIALGDRPRYAFAPGPPCETAYEPVTVPDWDDDREGHI